MVGRWGRRVGRTRRWVGYVGGRDVGWVGDVGCVLDVGE